MQQNMHKKRRSGDRLSGIVCVIGFEPSRLTVSLDYEISVVVTLGHGGELGRRLHHLRLYDGQRTPGALGRCRQQRRMIGEQAASPLDQMMGIGADPQQELDDALDAALAAQPGQEPDPAPEAAPVVGQDPHAPEDPCQGAERVSDQIGALPPGLILGINRKLTNDR